jgi:hypothetical protein
MAKVVGIVASGISIGELVAQIGSGVLRLKGYWGAVKEAPERIFDLGRDRRSLLHLGRCRR